MGGVNVREWVNVQERGSVLGNVLVYWGMIPYKRAKATLGSGAVLVTCAA